MYFIFPKSTKYIYYIHFNFCKQLLAVWTNKPTKIHCLLRCYYALPYKQLQCWCGIKTLRINVETVLLKKKKKTKCDTDNCFDVSLEVFNLFIVQPLTSLFSYLHKSRVYVKMLYLITTALFYNLCFQRK